MCLALPRHSPEQPVDILMEKAQEAFKPGAISWEVVEFIADLAEGKSYNLGDCRFALDILLTAGLTADSNLADAVTVDHVRLAASEWFDGISTRTCWNLTSMRCLSS